MSIEVEPRTSRRTARSPSRRSRSESGAEPAPTTPAPPRLPGRRSPKWIALGVVAICLGGLLSSVIYSRVATEVSAVAVTQTVYRGSTLTWDDLTTVPINPTSGLQYVPADRASSLVGKKALLDLAEGAVLTPGSVGDRKQPQDSRSLVGLRLAHGRVPLGLLVPGANVRLVALPDPEARERSDGYLGKAFPGLVVDHQPDPDGQGLLVNVDVPTAQAQDVSILAAQDRLALVRDADR